uniref:Uncharacterized protein n=1 Tax=Anopheles farauti TaxID=69004 RepID=A0A182QAW8_9DIPT
MKHLPKVLEYQYPFLFLHRDPRRQCLDTAGDKIRHRRRKVRRVERFQQHLREDRVPFVHPVVGQHERVQRERLRVVTALQILLGHIDGELLAKPQTPVHLELCHRFPEQTDDFRRMVVRFLVLLHQADDLLLGHGLARLDAAADAEEIAVQGRVGDRAEVGRTARPERGTLQEGFLPLADVLGRLVEVDTGMLGLQRRQPILDRVAEQLREGTVLYAQPGVVLEQQLLEAGQLAVLVDVVLELRYRIFRRVQAEEQLAHLVVDEPGDRFQLETVRVDDSHVVEEGVRLAVVAQRVRLVQLQLGDETELELVPDFERRVRVRQLIAVQPNLLHHLRVVGLRELEKRRLQPKDVTHQVVVVWKHEQHLGVDVTVAGELGGPFRCEHVLALLQMVASLEQGDRDARVPALERVLQHLDRGGTLQLFLRPLGIVPFQVLKQYHHRRQHVQMLQHPVPLEDTLRGVPFSTTNRLSQEYRSWSSSLLPSKLLARPTLSGDAECQASQYVSIARSPCALEPCHTSFWGL